MKSFQTHMMAMVFCVMFLGTQFFSLAFADEKIPEFDGGYVKTTKNEIIEIRSVNCEVFYTKYLNERYLVKSLPEIINVPAQDFKGFILKGGYDFSAFSLHPLVMKKEKINWKDATMYQPGKALELRKKAVAKDGYYYQPRNKIEQGVFVGWVGKSFWIFSIGEGKDVFFFKALSLYEKKKYSEAIKPFEKAAEEQNFDACRYLGMMYSQGIGTKQDYKKAIKWYKKAADDEGDIQSKQNLAWIFATCKDSKYHNGELAVKYGYEAHSQKPKNLVYLDTLAAAYARNGQFEKAIKAQERSIRLLKGPVLPPEEFKFYEESKEKISMYKRGQAYDESIDLSAVIKTRKERAVQEKKRLKLLLAESKKPTKTLGQFAFEWHQGLLGDLELQSPNNRVVGRVTDKSIIFSGFDRKLINSTTYAKDWTPVQNMQNLSLWFGNVSGMEVRPARKIFRFAIYSMTGFPVRFVAYIKDPSEVDELISIVTSAVSQWYDKYEKIAPLKKRPDFLTASKNLPGQKTQSKTTSKHGEDKVVAKSTSTLEKDITKPTKTENTKPQSGHQSTTNANKALVINIQQELKEHGYYKMKVDGIYGPGTAASIKAYQRDNNLTPDGKPSKALLAHLESKKETSKEPAQTAETKKTKEPQTLEATINKAVDDIFKAIFKK